MKRLLLLIAALAAVSFAYLRPTGSAGTPTSESADTQPTAQLTEARLADATSGNTLARAFENRRSNLQVQDRGRVIKLLPDDDDGSRHQRFILRLASGQTVLVAHNIDLAPRVEPLAVGDTVEFNGEYEWNAKGGVVHWTHRDPARRHEDGWLQHDGKTYQ